MTTSAGLIAHELAWTFHRNTSRWVHNAASSSEADDTPEPGLEYPERPFEPLPAPVTIDDSLSALLAARCSCRDFAETPMTKVALGTVLHHAYGVLGTDHWGPAEFLERPVPSGGGMYPLELHVITRNVAGLDAGVYHYAPLLSGLERARDVCVPETLMRYLFMGQYPPMKAAATIVITGVPDRSMKKYGDRGYRYLLLEAGHVAQNINLTCGGLGLQSLNVGGFFDDELASLCRCPDGIEYPLYAIAVGAGASPSRHRLRFSD